MLFDGLKIWSMSKLWFWRGRKQLSELSFRTEKFIYHKKTNISSFASRARITRELIFIGIKKFTFVGLALIGLEYAEYFSEMRFDLKPWPSASQYDSYNNQLEFYAVLLAAIFSIYFATIGIILSTGYARLKREIISLLISEQVGSFYTGTLIFSTAFCLSATALNVWDYQTGLFVYVAGSVLTLISILTLFPIGQRLFNFFELSPLIDGEIVPKITKNIDYAVIQKGSISFQNHFFKEAKSYLDLLYYIDGQLEKDHGNRNQNIQLLINKYSNLLCFYLDRKHRIPEQSYWFPRKRMHHDWFLAGDTATSMAISTSSQIEPKEEPNSDWLEEKLLNQIYFHLESALEKQDFELALDLLMPMTARCSKFAQGLYFSVGIADIRKVRLLIEKYLPDASGQDEEQSQLIMAIADAWTAIAHNFCLETLRRMILLDGELEEFFQKGNWSRQSASGLPTFIQSSISYLFSRVELEKQIEGQRQSQPKYLRQLTTKSLLETYEEIFSTIADFQTLETTAFTNKLIEAGQLKAATQTILSSLHAIWKLPNWYKELQTLSEKYISYQHYDEPEYQLPQIDFEKFIKGFEAERTNLIKLLADKGIAGHLFELELHNPEIPDHFGQAYYVLAEECFRALDENDSEMLNAIFGSFFALAFLASNFKFQTKEFKTNEEFQLHLISTVYKDIATILGFAIVYSEYYDNQKLKDVPFAVWDSYLSKLDDKKSFLTGLIRIADSYNFSRRASPRDLLRTSWNIKFNQRARSDGYGDRHSINKAKEHTSEIVNAFVGSSYYNASDVFFALHVIDELEETKQEANNQINSFKRELERHEKDKT